MYGTPINEGYLSISHGAPSLDLTPRQLFFQMHLAMTVVISMGRLRLVAILHIRESRWKINPISGSVLFYPEVCAQYKDGLGSAASDFELAQLLLDHCGIVAWKIQERAALIRAV